MKKYRNLCINWKFWTKLTIGIIPLVVIVATIVGMFFDYSWGHILSTLSLKNYDNENVKQILGYRANKNYTMIFWRMITRNIFLITTMGNIVFSTFFISSAFNTNNEGKGRIDNFTFGFSSMVIVAFIVIFFNISRLFDTAVNDWYGYISWIFLHSITQIVGIVYFILFYDFSNIFDKKNYKKEMIISLLVVNGYMIFWLIVGTILSQIISFRLFGFMSPSGYYPYQFLDIIAKHKMVMFGINVYIILPVLLILFEAGSIGLYFALVALVKLRLKIYSKKTLINKEKAIEKNEIFN